MNNDQPQNIVIPENNDRLNGSDGNDDLKVTSQSGAVVHGWGGNDNLTGSNGDDFLYGDAGDDHLDGGNGNDFLDGGDGNDALYGGDGNDTLDGGTGDDYLVGGNGDDTYVFGQKFGNDIIKNNNDDPNAKDVIRFKEGWQASDFEYISYTPASTSVSYHTGEIGDGLIIQSKTTNDKIRIPNQFYKNNYSIKEIQFADGTVLDQDAITRATLKSSNQNDHLNASSLNSGITLHGLGGDDSIVGTNNDDFLYGDEGNDRILGGLGNDFLDGGAGDDTLYGGDGDDILDGGSGNDILEGGAGHNVYLFGQHFGQDEIKNYNNEKTSEDVIRFKEGWTVNDFDYTEDSDHALIIQAKNSSDRIMVTKNHYTGEHKFPIQELQFADGTVLNSIAIQALLPKKDNSSGSTEDPSFGNNDFHFIDGTDEDDILLGTDSDDVINGGEGNDILIGGLGNDDLDGGDGSDTYIFGKNFGQDTIDNYDETPNRKDTIQFKEGWAAQDFDYLRSNNDLIIQSKTTTDRLIVDYHFDQDCQIDEIQFEDGTAFNADDIQHMAKVVDLPSDEEFAAATNLQGMKNAMASVPTTGSVTEILNATHDMTRSPNLLISYK